MATHKPFTEISTLPANANGEVTILEAHLDAAHDSIVTVIEYLAQAVWSSGGVVLPGTVTNPSGALVRVQDRLGVTADTRTLLAVADQAVDLADVPTGTRCLVVIQAKAGASTSHNFLDATTGESITHTLLSAWGRVEIIQGDSSNYPALPTDCVPVAQVTKTGAATLSLDSIITDPPTPRYAGGSSALATINNYAGSHSLNVGNSGSYVRITAAGTVTLPDGLPDGFQCVIVNATNGDTVELAAATTLTIPTNFEPEIQNRRAVTVVHVGSNVWEAHGALLPSGGA